MRHLDTGADATIAINIIQTVARQTLHNCQEIKISLRTTVAIIRISFPVVALFPADEYKLWSGRGDGSGVRKLSPTLQTLFL